MTTWEFQERGWYTAEGVGGICVERDGLWYCYPRSLSFGVPSPIAFRTLAEAKKWFEKRGN